MGRFYLLTCIQQYTAISRTILKPPNDADYIIRFNCNDLREAMVILFCGHQSLHHHLCVLPMARTYKFLDQLAYVFLLNCRIVCFSETIVSSFLCILIKKKSKMKK